MGVVIRLADRTSAEALKPDFIAVFIRHSESGLTLDAPGIEGTPDNHRMLARILFNASQSLTRAGNEESQEVADIISKERRRRDD
jgi:hypothetical protein